MMKDLQRQTKAFQKTLAHRLTFSFFQHLVETFPRAGTLPAILVEKLGEDLEKTEQGETRESSLELGVVCEVGEKWLVLVKVVGGVKFV